MIHPTMSLWEAIEKRISCRAYQDKKPDAAIITSLTEMVDALNQASGLHIQLICADGTDKPMLRLGASMFDGPAYVYAAMIGGKDDLSAEKIGYYGEKLVLYATQLGLGTCWVAGTYDPKSVCAEIGPDEKLWDVIPIGVPVEKTPLKQKMIRAGIRARDRKPDQFVEADQPFDQLPAWMQQAVKAVRLGPSAVNQQPVNITYKNGVITARLWKNARGLSFNDLGIAKYQFEAAAESCGVTGSWTFGDGASFTLNVK